MKLAAPVLMMPCAAMRPATQHSGWHLALHLAFVLIWTHAGSVDAGSPIPSGPPSIVQPDAAAPLSSESSDAPGVAILAGIAKQDARVDAAVGRGLTFLAESSKFDPVTRHRWWESAYQRRNTALASLAVMAFLARGHVPGEGPYGNLLNEAIDWVISAQQDNGLLTLSASHGPMYEHGISTLMLAEVLGMTGGPRSERVRQALGKAVALILAAQDVPKDRRNMGGWRYQPSSRDADLSVTGWQLMALRAAANAGVPVPQGNLNNAVAYIRMCEASGGGFGYTPGNSATPALCGTGIVALEVCAQHDTPAARRAANLILERRGFRWGGYEHWYYAIYYTSQAVYQVYGNDDTARSDPNNTWERYRRQLEEVILANQRPDGSWPGVNGHDGEAGPAYRTAMAILALSVHCKYLPIYQR